MRYLLIILTVFANSLCFSQPVKKGFNLKQIESNNRYQENINALESELRFPHNNNDELLSIQIALINNYIAIFQYDKAADFCHKEIIKAKKNNLPYQEATFYRYLGNVYYYLKQIDKAFIYWNKCLAISEEHNYYNLLKRCNHNIGVIAFETERDYAKAEKYFLKAIEYGKKMQPTKQDNIANSYRLLATTNDVMGRYKKADSLFEITTKIYQSFNDSAGIAEALTFHARLYISMKNYEKASKLCKEAVIISKKLKLDDHVQTALSIQKMIAEETTNYKDAYEACNEMLGIETAKQARNQKKEIAESEARFKVAEIKSQQEISEVKAQQSKQMYLYAFIILFILGIGTIILIYQKRNAKKDEAFKLESLKSVYEAEEKERTRIAKDLHDNMGAYATSILAQIDMLEYSTHDVQTEKIHELRYDAEHIMSTLRETIWILKNKTISIRQLNDLIRLYADKHLVKNLNITVVYQDDVINDKALSPTVSLNLYRIIQEAIQNIIKHAQANEVVFNVTCIDQIRLEIIDNGKGFDVNSLARKSGLDNMQHRAQEIGFEIQFKSQINTGTKISICEK